MAVGIVIVGDSVVAELTATLVVRELVDNEELADTAVVIIVGGVEDAGLVAALLVTVVAKPVGN